MLLNLLGLSEEDLEKAKIIMTAKGYLSEREFIRDVLCCEVQAIEELLSDIYHPNSRFYKTQPETAQYMDFYQKFLKPVM
ncbi:MAG: hypothetical protein GX309_13320 [Clostridiales bacterium]|nr:hypothetical protein [Clostridiales bacterium]